MRALLLCALLTACATAPAPTTNCARITKHANESLAAVSICQTIPGCTISLTDLKEVRAEVVAAERCE